MAKLLDRIPNAQDVPGLLRLWSPVWLTGANEGYRSAVCCLDELATVGPDGAEQQTSVALDLTDQTGRAHAAWWAQTHYVRQTPEVLAVYLLARSGGDITPAQIDLLARLVLRLAGRSHV